jgi:Flp pilus assembly protein TadD
MPGPVMPVLRRFRPLLLLCALGLSACAGVPGPATSHAPEPLNDKARIQVRLADSTRDACNYASAATLYKAALDNAPDDPRILLALGEAQTGSGQFDAAAETYRRVTAHDAGNIEARIGLGRIAMQLRRADQALAEFDAALARGSDSRARIGRGVALDTLGRHAEAQTEYRAVLTESPNHRVALNNLALSLALTGNLAEAEKLLVPLADGPASTPRFRQNLALVYGLAGEAERARYLMRADMDEAALRGNFAFYEAARAAIGNPNP